MRITQDFERKFLTTKGRSAIIRTAEELQAKPRSRSQASHPVLYPMAEEGRARRATSDELRYAADRSGAPLIQAAAGIEKATEVTDNPAVSLWAIAYENYKFGGRSGFMNFPREELLKTYLPVPSAWLNLEEYRLNNRISSVRVAASGQEHESQLFLFSDDTYRGAYLSIFAEPGNTTEIPDLRAYGFNDLTSSLMFIRGFQYQFVPIPIGSLLRPQLAAFVATHKGVQLRGYPIITWDMWPPFAPTQEYVLIRVPLTVDVDYWFDYDAELQFWCYFFVGADGQAYVSVDYYHLWVDDGILHDSIRDHLSPLIDKAAVALTQQFTSILEQLQSFPIERIVLHPGQPFAYSGRVEDDVSIVFVLERSLFTQVDWSELPPRPRLPVQKVPR